MSNENVSLKLENRLILLSWLNDQFGFKSNRELLSSTRGVAEGFDGEGRGFMYHHLRGRKVQIPEAALERYDDNIHAHLRAINQKRSEPIILRYFQYLSVLYSEVFLDWLFNRPAEFQEELNRFVADRNARKPFGEERDALFGDEDLTKLAFWMATGSGKTLLLHLNYLQFLHYNRKPLDNILLITPNEGLTEQHLTEMRESGIPCERFVPEESGLSFRGKNVVRTVEITKLVEEKKGGGVSVDVESFEGNNLIFVDEGHKGSGGDAWRRFRERLGQTGFTFEYSATFGQALNAVRKDELTEEYGKAIAFDYSYRYFYGDGYGKDFHILNLREETVEGQIDTLLLANLLSFYEQKCCFEEQKDELRPYNLEMPLWIFVGSSVNAVYSEGGRKQSDVLTVANFLHRFLENRQGWAVNGIRKIIKGESGLQDEEGYDPFLDKFDYLKTGKSTPEAVYGEILEKVLNTASGGPLHLANLRGSAGEIALKAGGAGDYFGLIYIGDVTAFRKIVEESDTGIVVEDDAITGSLFEQIDSPDSSVNLLIGAKKFMEGWSCWRVSNMGLLNIGRSEGSQIIQLFGRGVRLKGLNHGLKRSSHTEGTHPPHLRLLETLNIFAVRARYMEDFRNYLEREGVDSEGDIELPLAIKPNQSFLKKGLLVPDVPKARRFSEDCHLLLEPVKAARVTVDISFRVESIRGGEKGIQSTQLQTQLEPRAIPSQSLDLLDWEAIYLDLLEFKQEKGYHNLAIRPGDAKRILSSDDPPVCTVVAEEAVLQPRSFAEVSNLQRAAVSMLRKYTEKLYRVRKHQWESEHMEYQLLDSTHPKYGDLFQDYTLKISRKEAQLIEDVRSFLEEGTRLYERDCTDLPATIHFDRHLYQPLLLEGREEIVFTPPGLNPGEKQLVANLRDYVKREAQTSLAGKEIFLLRNQSKKGIGFFESEGFFPDFILWIKDRKKQRIVFVEPHGMRQEKAYEYDDKAQLHEKLKRLSAEMAQRSGLKNVELDSFVISQTPYEELHQLRGSAWDRQKFTQAHILFAEDSEHIGELFR